MRSRQWRSVEAFQSFVEHPLSKEFIFVELRTVCELAGNGINPAWIDKNSWPLTTAIHLTTVHTRMANALSAVGMDGSRALGLKAFDQLDQKSGSRSIRMLVNGPLGGRFCTFPERLIMRVMSSALVGCRFPRCWAI